MRILGQSFCFMVFMAFIALLSVQLRLRILPEQTAVISLSMSHAGQRVAECRRLTQEELNELPPNMRKPEDCPRERHPVRIEILADDTLLYRQSLPPSGLWSDGKSVAYERIRIRAGSYVIRVGMSDSGEQAAFEYNKSQALTLSPGQNLVVGFDEREKEITFL